MNILQLIFQLVHHFVPMNSGDFARIKDEGEQWYSAIRIDDDVENPNLLNKAKKHAEQWYSKLGFAIMFIILKRKIWDYMNGGADKLEDEEE